VASIPPSTAGGTKQPPPQAVILEMWSGYVVSRALYVVAELAIADHLADRPKTAAEVAAATGANEGVLHRVLQMLASRGVFAEEESSRFGLTPLSECLRSSTVGSVRETIRMYGEMHWKAVGNLLHSVMTGQPAFEEVAGSPVWEYLASHPDDGERFARGMANVSSLENQLIARAYDFSPFRVVIDLGGGRGGFIAEVLRANPGLRGVLYDEPHVVSRPTDLQESEVARRCQIVPGNFFESVPAGCDVYVLKRVLDGWDDDHALRILRLCRQAIPSHGRLLSIHALVPQRGPYSRKDVAILTTDMGMLVGGRGRERTEDQFRHLFLEAGFSLNRVIPTRSLLSIVEGVPA
jgi:hypothetical protein